MIGKKATIIPIPKIRTSPHPSDYRPISLTCVVGKIAERFVLSNINKAIDKELPQQQFGFRRNRGTLDALIEAEHRIMTAMEDCAGSPTRVAVISFDISKAFDTVSHNRLIEHLRNSFQLSLNARRWIQAFLVGRVQRVKVGTAFSNWSTISSGVHKEPS
jgi:retron-type reverse transcriptase